MAHLASAKKQSAHKHIKVSHIHAKPHRKRHYALLVASLALGVSVVTFFVAYVNQAAIGRAVASQTIASIFDNPLNGKSVAISSSYGFTISYNARQYYASGVDGETGSLYVGDELSTARPYDTIRLSDQASSTTASTNSLMVNYYPHEAALATVSEVEQRFVADKQSDKAQLKKVTSTSKSVQGIEFQRTEWSRTLMVGAAKLEVLFVTYAANFNGHPLTIIAYQGARSGASADAFVEAMTLSGSGMSTIAQPTARVIEKHSLATRILDTMLGTQTAYAASAPSYTASERISATYGPAVVKVYNVYVGDLMIDGKTAIPNYMNGGTGSGFIVSGDGHVATNGHVAVNDPKEVGIYASVLMAYAGNSSLLQYLVGLTSLQESDLAGKSSSEALKVMVQALYDIDASHFAFENLQTNLLVGLGEKQADITELVEATKNHESYPEQDTIKQATVVSYDYGGSLLPQVTGQFKTSDVALLKINSGSNYPMVKMGTMAGAAQGSNLSIMGFPGVGSSSNGIVSKTATSATLTTGQVSAQKKDNGGRSLIETDTEIGHGNSGGPAFNDAGDVIGIATYAVDTGESGDGVLNYIRDIADFTKVADKASVNYKTVSQTQQTWDKAIELFYQAHYKSAVKSFQKVQELYPNHPKTAEMIASAEKHIANGDNIDEFPTLLVVILGAVAVVGAIVAVIFIMTHKKKHQAYVHGVTSAQIQPLTPGMAPQVVIAPQAVFGQPQSNPFGQAQATPAPISSTSPATQPAAEVVPPAPSQSQAITTTPQANQPLPPQQPESPWPPTSKT